MDKSMGLLSPRITLEAIQEIRAAHTGLWDKYGSREAFEGEFDQELNLPSWSDTYGPMSGSFGILRTLTLLKTERER